jgi:hypothetical protein
MKKQSATTKNLTATGSASVRLVTISVARVVTNPVMTNPAAILIRAKIVATVIRNKSAQPQINGEQ